MPHFILEHSANIEKVSSKALFLPCHRAVVAIAAAKIEDCKSRIIRIEDFFMGNGDSSASFVHMRVFLMEGRTIEVRKKVGDRILGLLEEYFTPRDREIQISVEVLELVKELYFKKILEK